MFVRGGGHVACDLARGRVRGTRGGVSGYEGGRLFYPFRTRFVFGTLKSI